MDYSELQRNFAAERKALLLVAGCLIVAAYFFGQYNGYWSARYSDDVFVVDNACQRVGNPLSGKYLCSEFMR